MQIILAKGSSLTGTLNRKHGYAIRRTKSGNFVSVRNTRADADPKGHLAFILDCAQLAKGSPWLLADIALSAQELQQALLEAGKFVTSDKVYENSTLHDKHTYNASDVINLKNTFGL